MATNTLPALLHPLLGKVTAVGALNPQATQASINYVAKQNALTIPEAVFSPTSVQVSTIPTADALDTLHVMLAFAERACSPTVPLASDQMGAIAIVLYQECRTWSFEDLAIMLRKGSRGQYGPTYNKLSLETVSNWLTAYNTERNVAIHAHNTQPRPARDMSDTNLIPMPDLLVGQARALVYQFTKDVEDEVERLNASGYFETMTAFEQGTPLDANGERIADGDYSVGTMPVAVYWRWGKNAEGKSVPEWVYRGEDQVVHALTTATAARMVRVKGVDDAA